MNGPLVSIVLPTFNSSKTISNAIDSIIDQTYTNWELLVINDYDSRDGTAEIARAYSERDERIFLVQTEEQLGLANSLNYGIRKAKGKYIARMDADDVSRPERIEKQVKLMEKDSKIGVCGTWQYHHSDKGDWTHTPPKNPDLCKVNLMFWCNLCHSTLMIRKEVIEKNELFYDPSSFQEDFELWGRMVQYTSFTNIQEILGDYTDGAGITKNKLKELDEESGRIVLRNINHYFGIGLDENDSSLFNTWSGIDHRLRQDDLNRLKEIIKAIWESNKTKKVVKDPCLLEIMSRIWYKNYYCTYLDNKNLFRIKRIGQIFNERSIPSLYIRYKIFKDEKKGSVLRYLLSQVKPRLFG